MGLRGSVGRILVLNDEDIDLHMAIQSGMVQGCAPPSVRDIDAAQQGNDDFRTLDGLIGCCHVERGLPVLVPRVDVSRVLNQHLHCFLQQKQNLQGSLTNAQSILMAYKLLRQTLELQKRKGSLPSQAASRRIFF